MFAYCSTRYVALMEVYAERAQDCTPAPGAPKGIVKKWLVSPIKNAGRNVTTNSYCTSMEQKDFHFGLTVVGTI